MARGEYSLSNLGKTLFSGSAIFVVQVGFLNAERIGEII